MSPPGQGVFPLHVNSCGQLTGHGGMIAAVSTTVLTAMLTSRACNKPASLSQCQNPRSPAAQAKAWSRFFCHSVYVTMYLNDHMRASFYESLGLDTTQFNRC